MQWFAGAAFSPAAPAVPRPVGGREFMRQDGNVLWTVGSWTRPPALRSGHGWKSACLGPHYDDRADVSRVFGSLQVDAGLARVLQLAAGGAVVAFASGTALALSSLAGDESIFFVEVRGGVVFASHARPLAELTHGTADMGWLSSWLLCPGLTAPFLTGSPWRGVQRVPPGGGLIVREGKPEVMQAVIDLPPATMDAGTFAVRQALNTAVARHIRNTPSVTSDLSGGLDSTSITLLAASILGRVRPLAAITLHADLVSSEDPHCAQIAARSNDTIRHHALRMPSMVDPFARMDEAPATDEPFSDVVNHARLSFWFDFIAGMTSDVHLTGDAGDAVATAPLIYLADLARAGQLITLWRHAAGWARLRHQSTLRVFRSALRAARRTPRSELRQCIRWLRRPHARVQAATWSDHIAYAEYSPVAVWTTRRARELAADHFERHLAAAPWNGLSEATQVMMMGAQAYAHGFRAEAQLAHARGVRLAAPFLDGQVIRAFLSVRADEHGSPEAVKPLLTQAMHDVLPSEILHRRSKDDYTPLVYRGLSCNARTLRAILNDAAVADVGLIEPAAVVQALNRAATGLLAPIGALSRVLAVETWLRNQPARVQWIYDSQPWPGCASQEEDAACAR